MTVRKLIVVFRFLNSRGPYSLDLGEQAIDFDRRPGMHQEIDDQEGFRLTEEDKYLLHRMKIRTE